MSWLLVGLGGALGALARHGLVTLAGRWPPSGGFPIGIFLANVAGSLAIGALAGAMASARLSSSAETRAFLVVGVLGGFTTFSSFSIDTVHLMRTGHVGLALVNVFGQVGLSLAAAALGYRALS